MLVNWRDWLQQEEEKSEAKEAADRRCGSSKQVKVKSVFAALLAPEDFRNTLKQGLTFFTEKPLEQPQTAVPAARI